MSNQHRPFERVGVPGGAILTGEGAGGTVESRVLSGPTTRDAREFELPRLDKRAGRTYSEVKRELGPLAATDPDRLKRSLRDSRFTLNEHARSQLRLEAEESRALEDRVSSRIADLGEQARKRAAETGYRDGLARGREEAFESARTDFTRATERLEQVVLELEAARGEIRQAHERFLIELSFKVGRSLFLKELAADPEWVGRLVAEVIERVQTRDNIRVRVAPRDLEALIAFRPQIEAKLGALRGFQVEASDDVTGGAIVETEFSAVDATLEHQIEAVREALLGAPK